MWIIYKKLNVSPNSYPLVIPIKQYSSDFILKIKLYSTDGDLDIEAGATTKIRGTKRDGNGFELTGTRIGSTCTFSGTKAQMQQMTAAHGRCVFEIVVEKNTKELITANFYLEVQRAAMDAGTVTSESIIEEFADFQSKITAATQAAEEASASAESAASAAEQAVEEKFEEGVAETIDEWLTDHPEATTTVQDGAITEPKLASALKLKTIKDYVTPEMFGAVGDGTTDDTQAIQSCLDYASEHKVSVICKNDYSVSTIVIKNGIPQFVSLGTIHGKGLSGENGIVRLGTNDDALKNCIVSVNIDMSNGDAYGLYGVDTELCTIADCRIYGAVEHATIKKYCIHLKKAKSNIIKDNYVEMVLYAAGAYQYGIVLMFDLTASYGGYFDSPYGSVVEADNPPKDNVLIGNTILNGTHSIVVNGGVRNVISNNVCKYPSHRGVALTMSCFYNLIANNQFHAYGSTGVIMGYGAEHNEIIGNVFSDDTNLFPPDGEGAITAYVGIKFNKITGNKIFSKRRYGIYVAIDAVENVIENNAISGYRLAGIALENDWVPVGSTITDRTLPTDAKYSRPNYGNEAFYNTDGEQVQYLSYSNTEYNTIQGNHIKEGSGSNGAAIYVSQIGNRTKTTNNIIQNNVICPMSTGFYYLYVYENYENYLINNILKNNTFLGQAVGASKFHLPKWRKYFMEQKGNNFLDDADVRVSGSSISVGYGYLFRIINSSETTLTEITDGVHNQEILLRLDTHTTIKYNSATIRPKGLTDITPQSGNAFVRFRNVDGTWFEMSRNF